MTFDLVPQWSTNPPRCRMRFDQTLMYDDIVYKPKNFSIERELLPGSYELTVELLGKSDSDPDQCILIQNFVAGGIPCQDAVWQGCYQPQYPEPWASQQRARGIDLAPELYNTQALGWNGVWTLKINVPVYTWIHQTQNLGWIYN